MLVDEVDVDLTAGEEVSPDLTTVVSHRPSERPALVTVHIGPGLEALQHSLQVAGLAGGEEAEVGHDLSGLQAAVRLSHRQSGWQPRLPETVRPTQHEIKTCENCVTPSCLYSLQVYTPVNI